ncbi:aminoglycoside phosphotransferase family protein [Kribbella sp.]|uniref:phosphotransferase family protein n=1 Tax=Kribbella sp. TaxID=1871183 RepID=UPI002D5DDEA3|nr:aminoglycoside phosphotransferase family protein [Kribbella sp.]HZX08859.1 aminoglycoside phosphotransferase family protein [Kribbella sp.]
MKWLDAYSPAAIAELVRTVVPELSDLPIVARELVNKDEPMWWSSSAFVGGRYVAKFAWSRPAALRLAHEIAVLDALSREPAVPYLPKVVASSADPLLLVTELVPGASLFEVVDAIDPDEAGRQLAHFLAELHRAGDRLGDVPPAPLQPPTTDTLRAQIGKWIRPEQLPTVRRWCDWADDVLAVPRPHVLVHADLHGGNQIWDGDELRAIVDFETAGRAEPEYDLRAFPGTGPGVELVTATMHHYADLTGNPLDTDRMMAWHLRTALGDVLWRSEAGTPLADHRTPPDWINDLADRFAALSI